MSSSDLIMKVYAASSGGLDIIRSVCPQAAESEGTQKNFKLRAEERTPSAHLYAPDSRCDYWRVVDYGGGEGERWLSPVDLFMRERGYSQSQFTLALHELMEAYGVAEELNPKVNRPDITQREATADEVGQPPRLTLREGFTSSELAVWGPLVKAEHLQQLGWSAVVRVETTKDGRTTVKAATETYPIFAQRCEYTDEDGHLQVCWKVYEPLCFNKAFRFFTIGRVPRNYIYGLPALRRQFEERGEVKLDEVVIVSGGSDAANCLSLGYPPVWRNSETADLRAEDLKLLHQYAKRVVLIPDIDPTGIKTAQRLALSFPTLYVAWLTPEDMGGLHDNRGRQRKDLKDFIQLHPQKQAMDQLIARAKRAQFWKTVTDKQGQTEYHVSCTSLNYFLELNGFHTLKDDSRTEPVYIRIVGIKVQHITHKTIKSFLQRWMEQQGLPMALQDKVVRSRDLPNASSCTLCERDDLNFYKATATSQYFHFRNCWVEVTGDGIIQHRYNDPADHYVWEENIIPHDYHVVKDMFQVQTDEEGRYVVSITEGMELSKYFQFQINSCRLHWRKEDEQGLPLTIEEMAADNLNLASRLINLGYMLHSYKSESEAWATICLDSTLAESPDECNGRSGKSFHIDGISKMVRTFPINASTTPTRDNRFLFDGVSSDTDLVFVDECPKDFNFNFFYGQITNDLRVEEKNHHSFVIPFAESPKFAIATNFALTRHDPSTEGRMWPQVFSDYYHVRTTKNNYRETRTIFDDFAQNLMGREYSEADWQLDYAFMLQCLRLYLSMEPGKRKIIPPMENIVRREQLAVVGKDFKQWADEYFAPDSGHLDRELKQADVLGSYNQEASFPLKMRKLTLKLKEYCSLAEHIQCLNPAQITGQEKDGERWVKREGERLVQYYYVQSATAAAEAAKTAPVQTNLQFSDSSEEAATIGKTAPVQNNLHFGEDATEDDPF